MSQGRNTCQSRLELLTLARPGPCLMAQSLSDLLSRSWLAHASSHQLPGSTPWSCFFKGTPSLNDALLPANTLQGVWCTIHNAMESACGGDLEGSSDTSRIRLHLACLLDVQECGARSGQSSLSSSG